MSYAVLIDHEISELAATELVAELAAELAASFTLVKKTCIPKFPVYLVPR